MSLSKDVFPTSDNDLKLSNVFQTKRFQDFLNVIKSGDSVHMVRTATGILERDGQIPFSPLPPKSQEESKRLREIGNTHYKKGDYKSAILHYKKALATAPENSEEKILAYSNISAVMLAIKAYEGCQENIIACQELLKTGSIKNETISVKIEKRLRESYSNLVFEQMERKRMLQSDKLFTNYLNFDVKKNVDVPCASEDVCVEDIDGVKRIVAARDIKAGTIVAIERAYVSTLYADRMYTSCYFCHKMGFIHYPCDGCQALFCSKDCKERCMEDYHCIECQIMGYRGAVVSGLTNKPLFDYPFNILMRRAAIKMSLKLGWKQLSVVSQDMGYGRLQHTPTKYAFDANMPASILCNDDRHTSNFTKMWDGSVAVAANIHCLTSVPGYFPEDEESRKEAIDALSRVMMHLYTTFTSWTAIISAASDFHPDKDLITYQVNEGWFVFASKLAHSCEPNLTVLGLNDQVALVAIQRIKKGEELTISYAEHFYETNPRPDNFRQKMLEEDFQIRCDCRVCLQKWDNTTHVMAQLTPAQQQAFDRYKTSKTTQNSSITYSAAAEALDALTGLYNTTQHREVYKFFKSLLIFAQCYSKLNYTYDQDN